MIIIVVIGLIGFIGEKDERIQTHMGSVLFAGMIGFLVVSLFL